MQYSSFIKMLIYNAIVIIVYLLWNIIKKNSNKSEIFIRSFIMLLCPIVGPVFFLISYIFYKYIFERRADLSDVIFSKERVETHLKADEEREKNFVSIEEALAVTDKENLRELMMNVVKGDVKKSLGSVSMALNSEDSETAHYAASVLQDELNSFRDDVQKQLTQIEEVDEEKAQYASDLLNYMNTLLSQKVFTIMEQTSFVQTMDSVAEILFYQNRDRMLGSQYEAISLRLLEVAKYQRCRVWCQRCMEQYPNLLSSYTCYMKLYFKVGDRENFFEMLERLKYSNIVIDSETLELIRVFS